MVADKNFVAAAALLLHWLAAVPQWLGEYILVAVVSADLAECDTAPHKIAADCSRLQEIVLKPQHQDQYL